MARRAKELTELGLQAAIRKALADGKVQAGGTKRVPVGGVIGLHVQVRATSTAWILRYQAGLNAAGKPWRRDLGLGSYPDVPLAEARDRARDFRRQLRDGIDPVEQRRAQEQRVRAITFDDAAKRAIAAKAGGWKNIKHKAQWEATLATYASPIIGTMPVDAIELRHVERVLSPIWETKTETASRVRMRIEAVLDWATVAGHREGDNPARWKGNLDQLLPPPNKVKRKAAQPALPYTGMHRFMQALRKRSGSARALELAILTATRSGEVRGAVWSEIDLDAALWTIPARRMKADKDHVVPLSARAVEILQAQPRMAGSDLVFPAPRGGELSDATLAKVIKLMHAADVKAGGPGYVDPKEQDDNGNPRVVVPHGFRSTFRDWAAEMTAYPGDMAEMALAHAVSDKTEAAYRRGDMRAKRAKMMADWASYIDTAPLSGNVTHIREATA